MLLIDATHKYILYHTGKWVKQATGPAGVFQGSVHNFWWDTLTKMRTHPLKHPPLDVPVLILHYNKYKSVLCRKVCEDVGLAGVFQRLVHKFAKYFDKEQMHPNTHGCPLLIPPTNIYCFTQDGVYMPLDEPEFFRYQCITFDEILW